MITKILEKLGRKKIIHARDGDEEYMHRFYLLFKPRNDNSENINRVNLFLHNFKSSDDPILHDHPWNWFSLVLKGGYHEHYKDGSKKWRGPGSICFRKATDLHWVELKPGLDTWTLFGHGKRVRQWGFLFNGAWMYWRDYIRMKRNGN